MLPSVRKMLAAANTIPINALQVTFPGFLVCEKTDLELDPSVDLYSIPTLVGIVISRFGDRPISFKRYQVLHGEKHWIGGNIFLSGWVRNFKDVMNDPTTTDALRDNMKFNSWKYVIRTHGGTFPFNPSTDVVAHDFNSDRQFGR